MSSKNKKKIQNKKMSYGDAITDKFCMMFCCKDYYDKCIRLQINRTVFEDIKILYELSIGRRYLIKFETHNKKISEDYSKIIFVNKDVFLTTDAKTKNDTINHFSILLSESGPYCCSKFSKDNQHKCIDEKCNVPHINIVDKTICKIMYCDCVNEDCPSNFDCSELLKFLVVQRSKFYDEYIKDASKFEQYVSSAFSKFSGDKLKF